MGTSTCDILVAPTGEVKDILVKGICGQVPGSVIPGMTGLEAGQSAFGDAYAWFENLLNWEHKASSPHLVPDEKRDLIPALSEAASKLPLNENAELAIDWLNGRRTPDASQLLKGAITGLNLASDAPKIFKAIVESTCFGAKAIVDRFISEGIPVKGLIGLGGVARKSPFIMQMMADVMNRPIRIHRSEQTCAAGAAMFAATVAGIYPRVEDAMKAMGQGFDAEYFPDATKAAIYQKIFTKYQELGNFIEQKTNISSSGKILNNKYQQLRQAAYDANMQLPKLGLVLFTFGNVSVADRAAGVFAIKPSGVLYDELTPEKMVIVDYHGNIIDGDLRPSSDTKTHVVLYRHWPNIGSIVHTHSTHATAWAQAQRDIPIYGTTHADHNTINIPCATPMDDELIKGDYEYETGFQIINCLNERNLRYEEVEMILVGNHAPFTWGKTAGKAIYNAAVLEEIARMAYLTEQINPAATILKETLINKHWQRKHGDNTYYGQ
jgi:L-ribulokinase